MDDPSTSDTSEDSAAEWQRVVIRVRTAVVRAGLAGATLRGGLHLLSTLLYLMGKLRGRATGGQRAGKRAAKRGLGWLDAIKDTAKCVRAQTAWQHGMGPCIATWGLSEYSYMAAWALPR